MSDTPVSFHLTARLTTAPLVFISTHESLAVDPMSCPAAGHREKLIRTGCCDTSDQHGGSTSKDCIYIAAETDWLTPADTWAQISADLRPVLINSLPLQEVSTISQCASGFTRRIRCPDLAVMSVPPFPW